MVSGVAARADVIVTMVAQENYRQTFSKFTSKAEKYLQMVRVASSLHTS